MIKSLTELKKFLMWCKKSGISKVNIGGVAVEFTNDLPTAAQQVIATLPNLADINSPSYKSLIDSLDPESKEESDELLFWSTKSTQQP